MWENFERQDLGEEDTQKNKYLIFSIENENYGIATRNVVEVMKIQTITDVPETPDYVKGTIDLRGKATPVIDIRLKFQKESKEYDDRTRIIVVEVNDVSFGLIVDYVVEVSNVYETETNTQPETINNEASDYIEGMDRFDHAVWLFLNHSNVFNKD